MVSLSDTISRVKPSPTQAAAARAKELQVLGRDIVSLTLGEPDLDTPSHVKEAAAEALKKGFTKYTSANGIQPLREAICSKLKRDQGLTYSPAEIIVTCGGKQALATACAVLLNPGYEAIIPAPYWTSYPDMVKLAGGIPVIVDTRPEDGFLMTAQQLKKACTSKTKMLFLNSPSNPTGACYGVDHLKALAEVIRSLPNRSEIVVMTDEVYENITYDDFQHVSFCQVAPDLRDNTILVNAFSKCYSMTGWRVGYAAGPLAIINAMVTHQSQFTSHVCSIAQYAAAVAYSDNLAFPKKLKALFTERLEILCEAVERMPGVSLAARPQGAFFGFLLVKNLLGRKVGDFVVNTSEDLQAYLLEKFDVAVVAGEAFGFPGAIRVSFALDSQELVKGLQRIAAAADSLQ